MSLLFADDVVLLDRSDCELAEETTEVVLAVR